MPNKEYNITHTQMGGGELKEDLGGGSSALTPATADTLGGVKIGNGISVTEDGTISAEGGEKPAIIIPVYGKQGPGHNVYEDDGAYMAVYNELLPAYEDGTPLPDEESPEISKMCHLENFDPEALINSDSAYIEFHMSKSYGAPEVLQMQITAKVYDDTEGQEMVLLHGESVRNQFTFSPDKELQDITIKMACYVMLVKIPGEDDWVSMLNKSEAVSGMLMTAVTKTLS